MEYTPRPGAITRLSRLTKFDRVATTGSQIHFQMRIWKMIAISIFVENKDRIHDLYFDETEAKIQAHLR